MDVKDYIKFVPSVAPSSPETDEDLWFIFYNTNLLVKVVDDNISIPSALEVKDVREKLIRSQYMGKMEGRHCFSGEVGENVKAPYGMEFKEFRALVPSVDEATFLLCSKAMGIVNWDRENQFCGKCGTKMEIKEGDRAKVCPNCGLLRYPSTALAIIVAVVRDGKILLAHNNNFPPGRYSTVAGYVDPGETFEACVMREVFEETGIRVKNIKYFTNQPWPFPNSHMIAFTAEYAEGEIVPDGVEIGDAGWFGPDELPNLPTKGSVARKLVDWYLENYSIQL